MNLDNRDPQTKVKHEILSEYLRHWGYIITMGLTFTYATQQHRRLATRFVYVDCFSFMGQYAPEDGKPVYGSPIIGISGLDALAVNFQERNGVTPTTNAILFEENTSNFRALLETLNQCGYQDRVKQTVNFHLLNPGEIAVINGDCREYIGKVLEFTGQRYTWSFYLLDPYGPKGIPLDLVGRVAYQDRVDTIINLPYQDLHKKTGSAGKTIPDPRHIPLLERYDDMYGEQTWRHIATSYYQGDIDGEEMEARLVSLYSKVLHQGDLELALKSIPLKFPAHERTMYYLFLTTHDGTGALKMNEILDSAKISEYDHRQKYKKPTQMSMFDMGLQDPSRPAQNDYDTDDVADMIYGRCAKDTLSYKAVLARLADLPYYLKHVERAISKLKKDKKCSYEKLTHKEIITFH